MPTPISIKRRINASTYEILQPATTWTQVADKPATFTPTGHSHGNITDTGTIIADTAIASGQKLVLVNGSNAIVRSALAFGSATTTFLRNDGTWQTPAGSGVNGSGTTNELSYWSGASTLGTLATATYPSLTELARVKGVTSAIQTQIDSKAPTAGSTSITTLGTVSTGTWSASTIAVTRGGTGTTTAPTTGGIIWATSTSAYASTALGTSGQFLQSAGTSTPVWANLTTNITTISNLAPNTYSSSFSVTGYRWVIITGFKNSALTETIFQEWVDLNDTNQYSATARTRRVVWNNDTATFADDLTIQNSTGLRLQFAAGINVTYRLDGVR